MNQVEKKLLLDLATKHGTPIFVIDHDKLRANFREFREKLPEVQPYFAIKANSHPEIVKTMFDLGASFDVASMPEFMVVHENIKNLPDQERQDFIWDKIIYANTIKPVETLKELNPYKPLVTFDNPSELEKIKEHAPDAGLVLRIRVPNTGSMVELSSKFGAHPGEAVDLITQATNLGLGVEGISFHVGSQCNNFDNYMQALNFASSIFKEAELRKYPIGFKCKDGSREKVLDIGGGFPVKYTPDVKSFTVLAKKINSEIKRLFKKDNIQVIAEPGRFMVATACTLVVKIIGKAVRDGKTCYYLNDGVYHTFSGQVFDHQHYPLRAFKEAPTAVCATFGPTCDAFDTISLADELPDNLEIHDLLYAENIGAYSHASATYFNGFPPAKVVHVNKGR
ncbi:decarboxylase [Candidatus Falkowbacteria bacterium RIFCSPLOWO2_12_FULL_45_13]|uniref:ornithine decarboxylase n=2 Tax=Candidatus Falkowiibacteriota TaxID=1752728 RepID=A0A1F5SB99_9BACT|nr:MAG: decarboxylase [Candidatus Falkowbacteria bacterium RIFCSPLOWO2_02_FULL_45_21]OGF32147.1 MAG: decarboxylase [Candidatus Falkowbacteria bacterium RIFCSPLOWO2_12_FULL_45_13]